MTYLFLQINYYGHLYINNTWFIKPPGMGRGVRNSLPSLGLQVIRTKVSISLQYEKPVIQSSPLAFSTAHFQHYDWSGEEERATGV